MSAPTATEQNLLFVVPGVLAIALLQRGYIYFNVDNSYGPFTRGEVQLFQHSWEAFKNLGLLLFKNIITAAPSALSFYSFKDVSNVYDSEERKRDVKNDVSIDVKSVVTIVEAAPSALSFFSLKNLPDLYESEALKRHGKIVVTAVEAVVGDLREAICKYRDLLLVLSGVIWYFSTQFTVHFHFERKTPTPIDMMPTPTTTEQNLTFLVPGIIAIALLELLQRGYMYFKMQKSYQPFTEEEIQLVGK
jgi:hypothetical protein